MLLIYQFTIFLYSLFIKIAALFNAKAKLLVNGRKEIFNNLATQFNASDYVYWFHCASLGEFEQAKPLLIKIKQEEPLSKILVTFFSPSGYEIKKNDALADYVCYLPSDTKKNARKFIEAIHPNEVYFVKYEFWYFFLQTLQHKKIPTYLLSGVFRKSQPFFKFYGSLHRKMLRCFTYFFLQNTTSEKLLHQINIKNTLVTGDTRIDNVYKNAQHFKEIPLIKQFKNNKKVIILGSSWQKEEEIIVQYIASSKNDFKYIIAPHNVSKQHVKKIKTLLNNNCLLFSEADTNTIFDHNVLIINNIGLLASIYQYTDIAFVGGGFSGALHNILEPASVGNAIVFGPHYHKFFEATELMKEKAAFSVDSLDSFIAIVNYLQQDDVLNGTKNAALNYIKKNIGATEKIWNIKKEERKIVIK